MTKFLFWLAIIIWLIMLFSGHSPTVVGPPPVPPQSPSVISGVLILLDIVNRFPAINEAEAAVPPNSLSPPGSTFRPQDFVQKNSINNTQDVQSFDAKALKIYTACSYRFAGEINPIARREGRVSCLRNYGYNTNDMAYIGGKFAL